MSSVNQGQVLPCLIFVYIGFLLSNVCLGLSFIVFVRLVFICLNSVIIPCIASTSKNIYKRINYMSSVHTKVAPRTPSLAHKDYDRMPYTHCFQDWRSIMCVCLCVAQRTSPAQPGSITSSGVARLIGKFSHKFREHDIYRYDNYRGPFVLKVQI